MNSLDTPNGHRIRAELQHWFVAAQITLEHGGLTLLWPELDDLKIRVGSENRYKKDTVSIYVQGKEGLYDLVALSQLKRQTLVQASGRPPQLQPKRVALAVIKLYVAVEPYYLHSQGVRAAALKALLSAGYSGEPDQLKLGDLSFALGYRWGVAKEGGAALELRLVPLPVNHMGYQRVARYKVRLGRELDSAEFLQQVQELLEALARVKQEQAAHDQEWSAAKSLEARLRADYPEVDDDVISARSSTEVRITAICPEAVARKILPLLSAK